MVKIEEKAEEGSGWRGKTEEEEEEETEGVGVGVLVEVTVEQPLTTAWRSQSCSIGKKRQRLQ